MNEDDHLADDVENNLQDRNNGIKSNRTESEIHSNPQSPSGPSNAGLSKSVDDEKTRTNALVMASMDSLDEVPALRTVVKHTRKIYVVKGDEEEMEI